MRKPSKPKRSRYRVCAYCGKREYDLSTMTATPAAGYRSEAHYAHKKCLPATRSNPQA